MSNFPEVSLTTPRLLLRPLQMSDAAALFAMNSNAEVTRYGGTAAWNSITQAEEKIIADESAMRVGSHLNLAIIRSEDNQFIGTCTLFHWNKQCRRAEIGYSLHPDAWGCGYMREALHALISYAFTTLNLNRLEADIDPRNYASAKLLTYLRFNKEGFLPQRWIVNDEKFDSDLYGLLSEVW